MNKAIFCFLASTLAAANASAAILYNPSVIGSSARVSEYGSNDQFGFRSFDNFTLLQNANIERATWYAFWIDFNNPVPAAAPSPDVLTWEISFYGDNAGIPGTLLATQPFTAADVASNHQGDGSFTVGDTYNVSFYEYSVDLTNPFLATAGTQYWISILARSTNYAPTHVLRGATGGDDSSYQQQLGAGESVTSGNSVARDRAIVLEGSPVPEPGTFALSAAALLLLPLAHRFRRR